jgi:hypothetical protein
MWKAPFIAEEMEIVRPTNFAPLEPFFSEKSFAKGGEFLFCKCVPVGHFLEFQGKEVSSVVLTILR